MSSTPGVSYESGAFSGRVLSAVTAVNAMPLHQLIGRRICPEVIGRLCFRVFQSTGTNYKTHITVDQNVTLSYYWIFFNNDTEIHI